MHIILKNKNQMTYNLIQLLYQSNLDLIKQNQNFTETIINLETNFINLLIDYDFSNMFRDGLNDISSQLANFTGEVYDKLVKLITE